MQRILLKAWAKTSRALVTTIAPDEKIRRSAPSRKEDISKMKLHKKNIATVHRETEHLVSIAPLLRDLFHIVFQTIAFVSFPYDEGT